jgi:hypothetical protein
MIPLITIGNDVNDLSQAISCHVGAVASSDPLAESITNLATLQRRDTHAAQIHRLNSWWETESRTLLAIADPADRRIDRHHDSLVTGGFARMTRSRVNSRSGWK